MEPLRPCGQECWQERPEIKSSLSRFGSFPWDHGWRWAEKILKVGQPSPFTKGMSGSVVATLDNTVTKYLIRNNLRKKGFGLAHGLELSISFHYGMGMGGEDITAESSKPVGTGSDLLISRRQLRTRVGYGPPPPPINPFSQQGSTSRRFHNSTG